MRESLNRKARKKRLRTRHPGEGTTGARRSGKKARQRLSRSRASLASGLAWAGALTLNALHML